MIYSTSMVANKSLKGYTSVFATGERLDFDSTDLQRAASSIFIQTASSSFLKIGTLCGRRDSNSETKLPLSP